MILCGHCGKRHPSVSDVRTCTTPRRDRRSHKKYRRRAYAPGGNVRAGGVRIWRGAPR